MLIALLSGIIIGYILAIPPGPVGITAIRLSLSSDTGSNSYMALGTGIMDSIFCLSMTFTSTALMHTFGSISNKFPLALIIIQLLISIGFIIFGFFSLKTGKVPLPDADIQNKSRIRFIENLKSKGPFFLGIGLALANVPNPTFLPSIAFISASAQKLNLYEVAAVNNLFFSLGYGLGNMLWIMTLSKAVSSIKDRVPARVLLMIRRFAGFSLIGMGTFLGYRLITITHWGEILRFVFAI